MAMITKCLGSVTDILTQVGGDGVESYRDRSEN